MINNQLSKECNYVVPKKYWFGISPRKFKRTKINIPWEEVISSVLQQLMQFGIGEMQVNILLILNYTWKPFEVCDYKCYSEVQVNQEFVYMSTTHQNRILNSKVMLWNTTKFLHETPLKPQMVTAKPRMLTSLVAQPSVKEHHSSVSLISVLY